LYRLVWFYGLKQKRKENPMLKKLNYLKIKKQIIRGDFGIFAKSAKASLLCSVRLSVYCGEIPLGFYKKHFAQW
jgi:hypothetical protein